MSGCLSYDGVMMNSPATTSAPDSATRRVEQVRMTKLKPIHPDEIIRLWILRLTAHYLDSSCTPNEASMVSRYARRRRSRHDAHEWTDYLVGMLVAMTGVDKPPEGASEGEAQHMIRTQLGRRIRTFEKKLRDIPWLDALDPNAHHSLRAVGALLGLNDSEQLCLAFLLMLKGHEHLRNATSVLGCELDDLQANEAVAKAVGLPLRSVQEAFSGKGRLMGSQLIRRNHDAQDLAGKFEWVSRGFPQEMMQPGFDPFKALRDRIVPAPPPTLAWGQFSHLGELQQVTLS